MIPQPVPPPIDHVTLRVSDLDASLELFGRVFELLRFDGAPFHGERFHEWNDFSIAQADEEHPATRRLHVAFRAQSRAQVDAWWEALTSAGYPNDGAPGPRPQYSPDYYGAFILDPDGNSIEAVHHDSARDVSDVIDHLWIRVADLEATSRFYTAVAQTTGLETREREGRLMVVAAGGTFSLLEGPPTQNLHLAIAARDEKTVQSFYDAGLAAGGRDNGGPGERPEYHRGYYGAYLLDPDGNNIEAVWHKR
jgi:catechol 2,3-dioxygenase-like lactoylglutathione lyase family enzyme